MTDQEFLARFTECIGADPGSIQMDTELHSVEMWDSVAYISVLTLVDESFGVALHPERLVDAKTPASILAMATAQP
jgi:acyl carrier protein